MSKKLSTIPILLSLQISIKLVYKENFGYDDYVLRFDTMEEVQEEVLRVMRLVQRPVDALDEKEEKKES